MYHFEGSEADTGAKKRRFQTVQLVFGTTRNLTAQKDPNPNACLTFLTVSRRAPSQAILSRTLLIGVGATVQPLMETSYCSLVLAHSVNPAAVCGYT